MAARYANQSVWYHNTSDGLDHYVELGAARDTVTDAFVTGTYAALFSSSPVAGLPPKVAVLLAGRPRGWES